MGPIDPTFFDSDEMRAALAARDIGTIYRLLGRLGVSQRRIAQVTGQSQSEVCEILKGRKVRDVWVLERIADGLGVPRAWMGLGYGEEGPVVEEADGDTQRLCLRAATSTAALGQALPGLGELSELPLPTGAALPSRLDMSHVHIVTAVTEQLRGVARYYGGQAGVFCAAAMIYTRWMQVPATDAVKAALAAALAELHTEAGWWCHDSGVDGTGHFTRALAVAGTAGDSYGIANAALHAGVTLVRSGHPNDALTLFQLGQLRLTGFVAGTSTARADDPRVPTVTARLKRQSATAYAVMNYPDEATRCLAEANDGWAPRDAFESAGADFVTAAIQLDLGRLDAAERSATSALRTYGVGHRRGRTLAELLLAEVHVRAGESQGLTLAHQAIEKVSTLQSAAARRERLIPLATALEARPGADTQELARTARQIATTRM
ncbi:MAG: helix-turn-helix domain-containing protein [Pseudonocardiaceae bacterium]